jgi:hypothetical protein
MITLLSSSKIMESRTLMESALLGALSSKPAEAQIELADIAAHIARFSHRSMGEGLSRLETLNPELRENEKVAKTLAASNMVTDLDRAARDLSDQLAKQFADSLAEVGKSGSAEKIQAVVRKFGRA